MCGTSGAQRRGIGFPTISHSRVRFIKHLSETAYIGFVELNEHCIWVPRLGIYATLGTNSDLNSHLGLRMQVHSLVGIFSCRNKTSDNIYDADADAED